MSDIKTSGQILESEAFFSRNNEIDLSILLRTLWRGKIWIVLCAVIGFFLGGYYAFVVATPEYTASSVVMLESRQEQVLDLDSVVSGLSGDQATINTEVEVIRARGLLEKLVIRLDLTTDPEFNVRLRPTRKYSLKTVMTIVRDAIEGPPPPAPEPTERQILDSTIDQLRRVITVTNIRQSYVFRLTAVTKSAKKSALIANELAALYILDQLEVKFAATEQATSWLTERVAELQVSLEQSENAAKEFNTNTDLISVEALGALNRQIKDLRERQLGAMRTIAEVNQRIDALKMAQTVGDTDALVVLTEDRTLLRTRDLLHGGGSTAQTAFDARVTQIIDRAELDHARAMAQNTALLETIADLDVRIESQSNDLLELQQLRREAEASRLIYEYFLNRLKETSVQQGIQQADSRLLSSAVVPNVPSEPRKSLIVALSLLIGVFVGAAGVLAREMSQTGIRTAEELEKLTGRTVMGQIPMIPARRRKNVLQYLIEKPNSAAAEAVRNLRTSALLSNLDNPLKVIMSTSSLPGEGKTTQSLALAQNFAGLGKKVLLIEGDIRRRVFSQYFDIKEKRGLLSVLSGEAELQEVVTYSEDLRADVLIGEMSTTNAADVFSSKRFAEVLSEARELYDAIIIDTPPVLVVPDARVIGQSVDAILYTVKWDSTTRTQVREGLRMFETVNLKVTGLVLGQIDAKGMKRYGYGGEYGAYGAYGAKYYHN